MAPKRSGQGPANACCGRGGGARDTPVPPSGLPFLCTPKTPSPLVPWPPAPLPAALSLCAHRGEGQAEAPGRGEGAPAGWRERKPGPFLTVAVLSWVLRGRFTDQEGWGSCPSHTARGRLLTPPGRRTPRSLGCLAALLTAPLPQPTPHRPRRVSVPGQRPRGAGGRVARAELPGDPKRPGREL